MKENNIWNKVLKIGTIIILLMGIIYFFVSYSQLKYSYYREAFSGIDNVRTIGKLEDNSVIVQEFQANGEYIKGIELEFANYGYTPQGQINVLVENDDIVFANETIDAAMLPDSSTYYVNFGGRKKIDQKSVIRIEIVAKNIGRDSTLTLWMRDKYQGTSLLLDNKSIEGTLVMIPDEYVEGNFVPKYVLTIGILLLCWILFILYEKKIEKQGEKNAGTEIVHIFDNYYFLLSQLVSRDFKTKYRRSYLGIMWSLLSPIFMMIIVSSVFSFVFRFDIENFPVYLILGQITFSVFSEATQIAGTTITGAGQLIKKVYLPKYIFPLSKVTFSFVNFMLSFVAAFGVMAFYGIKPSINMLFLPLWIIEFYIFTLGFSMLLSAAMVFFRDIQHLYSLIVLAWGYVTPIFYPVSSLSGWMQTVMNFNPLYHYIRYIREILLYGNCPSLNLNILCLLMAIVSFFIGATYFYKKQRQFILYI